MIFPNKTIPLDESLLSKTPHVLSLINTGIHVNQLAEQFTRNHENIHDLVLILDILYILNKIGLDPHTELITPC